jgi:hypothetical protein
MEIIRKTMLVGTPKKNRKEDKSSLTQQPQP